MRIRSIALTAALAVALSTAALAQRADYFSVGLLALTNTTQTVKSGPGALIAFQCFNPNATAAYLQFFNTVAAVVVGTTPPTLSWVVQPGTTSGIQTPTPAGAEYPVSAGMKFAAATTAAGGVAPTTPLECDVFYR